MYELKCTIKNGETMKVIPYSKDYDFASYIEDQGENWIKWDLSSDMSFDVEITAVDGTVTKLSAKKFNFVDLVRVFIDVVKLHFNK